jgi:hypothetical protein
MSFALLLAHLGAAALWLGSMGYSLFVVQPRLARVLRDPAQVEDVYRELAAGNRWRVAGLIGVLGLSGLALVATSVVVGGRRGQDRAVGRRGGAVLVGVVAWLAPPRVRVA